MDIARLIRRQAQYIVAPMIGLTISGYFAYHLINGDRGLLAWDRLKDQIREAKASAAEIRRERDAAELRVSMLRDDHLDPDLLDEEVRHALNLVAPGEVVILLGEPPK